MVSAVVRKDIHVKDQKMATAAVSTDGVARQTLTAVLGVNLLLALAKKERAVAFITPPANERFPQARNLLLQARNPYPRVRSLHHQANGRLRANLSLRAKGQLRANL